MAHDRVVEEVEEEPPYRHITLDKGGRRVEKPRTAFLVIKRWTIITTRHSHSTCFDLPVIIDESLRRLREEDKRTRTSIPMILRGGDVSVRVHDDGLVKTSLALLDYPHEHVLPKRQVKTVSTQHKMRLQCTSLCENDIYIGWEGSRPFTMCVTTERIKATHSPFALFL